MKRVVIMGIDPGLANLGWGVIASDGTRSELLEFGCLTTKADTPTSWRLRFLYEGLAEISARFEPALIGVETLYFARNTKSAIDVAQARGAAVAAVASADTPIHDITPLQIKQALTGYGRAEKNQIQRMVQTILNLEDIPRPDHAADALAIAIACAHGMKRLMR